MTYRIGLIDDHPLILESLAAIVESVEGWQIAFRANGSEQLFANIQAKNPDLILLDVQLQEENGLEILTELRTRGISCKVIILTGNISDFVVKRAIENGAQGFLSKDIQKEEIVAAIETVLSGGRYVAQSVRHIAQRLLFKQDAQLTEREIEVVQGICEGLGYKEIGERLFISPRTVENHRSNILDKLGLSNNIELVRYAIKNHLVE